MTEVDYDVYTLKRRRVTWTRVPATTYRCKCGFATSQITVAFVHAKTTHKS